LGHAKRLIFDRPDIFCYNITMNTIIVEGPENAIRAGTWAEKNIKHKWALDVSGGPFSNSYAFTFSDAKDATHFALKWL
jgi:hypothetical protein